MLTERETAIANALKMERADRLEFLNERERRIGKTRIDNCCIAVAKALGNWDDMQEFYSIVGISLKD